MLYIYVYIKMYIFKDENNSILTYWEGFRKEGLKYACY